MKIIMKGPLFTSYKMQIKLGPTSGIAFSFKDNTWHEYKTVPGRSKALSQSYLLLALVIVILIDTWY